MDINELRLDKVKSFKQPALDERSQEIFNYLKEKLPDTPEYVVYDWFYKNNINETQKNIEEVINKYKDVEWELKENFHMSLNILSKETKTRLKERWGGIEKKGLEGDLERHQTQADLIKSQGISKEPIIMLDLNGKYELVEGWHRTIQIFKLSPEGFEYPNVWIGKSNDGADISIYISKKITRKTNPKMKIYNNITWFFRRLKRVWDFLPIIWKGYDFDYSHAIGLFKYQLERTADLLESDKAYTVNSNIHAQKIRTAIRLMDIVYDEEYMEDFYKGKLTIKEAIKKQKRAHQLLWKFIEHNIQHWWD